MEYPVTLECDEDGVFIATFSHSNHRFQGVADGGTQEEALHAILQVIEAAISVMMQDAEDVPLPHECEKGTHYVMISPMVATKVQLYRAMRSQGLRKADVARSMQVNQKQVDRIFNPRHSSTLLQLSAAAHAMGMQLAMEVRPQ
jgi:antitoxin HicB